MSEPIVLDLRKLTQAHVDEALPHIRGCNYNDPCIIGTLMTPEQRADVEHWADCAHGSSVMVDTLISEGRLEFWLEGQEAAAYAIQQAFDDGKKERFLELVQPWVEASA